MMIIEGQMITSILSKFNSWDRGISRFDWHYIMHRRWVYEAWRWLLTMHFEFDVLENDIRYWDFKDWIRECWEWSPDAIRIKSTYDMGDCSQCKHLQCDHLLNSSYYSCHIQSDRQYDIYLDSECKPITYEEIKRLTCNLFSEHTDK